MNIQPVKNGALFAVTEIRAAELREGSSAGRHLLGYFSSWEKVIATIQKNANLSHETHRSGVSLGFFVEEIIPDEDAQFLSVLPQLYHRTWLLNEAREVMSTTPGIFELWEHGTTRTKMLYKAGDRVAYLGRDCVLQAGIVVGVPRRKTRDTLREVHKEMFHDDGVDITDEYLWYTVMPFPSDPYDDVQLVQTEIFSTKISVSKRREGSLEKFRARILRD
jgi:hypothetical protein